MMAFKLTAALMAFATTVLAQSSCSNIAPSGSIRPSIASGYRMAVVATGLSRPRSIQFDTAGNLLVVEARAGTGSITALTLRDDGGTCLSVDSNATVIDSGGLNHGIALSSDGSTLFASSSDSVWSWAYDAQQRSASNQRQLIQGMNNSDHTTRTLLLSQMVENMLLVSRGSTSNIDLEAAELSSGHSQIKAFDISNISTEAYDFPTAGLRLGWGLRNSVGVAEHPETGGIYSVENSVDQIFRKGEDVHSDNPGEELNFHGYLNGTEYAPQGGNYGYPYCYAAWVVSELPDNGNLTVGSQFAIDQPDTDSANDTYCAELVPPRLTFAAHMAPLDIKFNNSGTEAWISFHGSWNRDEPAGYKLSVVEFANGEPVAAANSNSSATDILANADNSLCPDDCFRPAGIAFDQQGRLFMSSDATGEIYVVVRDTEAAGTPTTSSGASGSSSTPSQTGDAMKLAWTGLMSLAFVAAALLV